MSFAIYLIGFAIFIGGLAWALITLGMPQPLCPHRVCHTPWSWYLHWSDSDPRQGPRCLIIRGALHTSAPPML